MAFWRSVATSSLPGETMGGPAVGVGVDAPGCDKAEAEGSGTDAEVRVS